MPTPWRRGLYREIERLNIAGRILDLGGSRTSGYHELIGGDHRIDVANIDDASGLDLKFDLEGPFPIASGTYDAVLAFNVLEHIFNYRGLLGEALRVLKPGGSFVVGVPFLIQVHPSPNDHWRYTGQTLAGLLRASGFKNIEVKAIGNGPCTASVQLMSGIFSVAPVRAVCEYMAKGADWLIGRFVRSRKLADMYPLGYFVIARK